MAIPFIRNNGRNDGILNRFSSNDLVWSDEFVGSTLDPAKWKIMYMREHNPGQANGEHSALSSLNHQQSNKGQDRDGLVGANKYPDGKRHDCWYDNHHDKTIKVANGNLTLSGFVSNETDPTTNNSLHPYIDLRHINDTGTGQADWRKKVYVPWIDTASVKRVNDVRTVDEMGPGHYWRYGYFELDVDFRLIHTPGFRVSAWLMPIVDPEVGPRAWPGDNTAYNTNESDGQEMDIFEYENSGLGRGDDRLLMKNIDDKVGGIHKDHVIAPDWGYSENGVGKIIDPRVGTHTVGMWWTPFFTAWYLDGVEVNRDPNPSKIAQYLSITREGNSCVGTDNQHSPRAHPPQRIKSDGWLWDRNMGCFLDRVQSDKAVIGYVRIWQDPTLNGSGRDSNFRSDPGTPNVLDPATPAGNQAREPGAPAHGSQIGTAVRTNPMGGPSSGIETEYGRDGHVVTGAHKRPNEYTDNGYSNKRFDPSTVSHDPGFMLSVSGNQISWSPVSDATQYDVKVGANVWQASLGATTTSFPLDQIGKYFITAITPQGSRNSLEVTVNEIMVTETFPSADQQAALEGIVLESQNSVLDRLTKENQELRDLVVELSLKLHRLN